MIGRLMERRTHENPNVPLQAAYDYMVDGGRISSAGVRVNHRTALGVTAFWRALVLIASGVAKTPFDLFVRKENDGREKDKGHPAYRLARHKANKELLAFHFRMAMQSHALDFGNGFAWILRNGAGDPLETLLLPPDQTNPLRVNGELWYVTRFTFKDEHREEFLRPEDVIHIRGLSFDGLTGYDVVNVLKDALGLSIAALEFGAKNLANMAHMGLVVESPMESPILSPEAVKNLRQSIDNRHSGVSNAFKTVIMEEGRKITVLNTDAKKAQLIEVRKLSIVDVSNITGVPPGLLGDSTRNAYASREQEHMAFREQALDPWMCQWEQEYNDKMLTEKQKESDTHYFEFNRAAIQQVDTATETANLATALNSGWMNLNEVRRIRNLPTVSGPTGEQFRLPSGTTLISDEEPDEGDEPESDPDPSDEPLDEPLDDDGDRSGAPDRGPAQRGLIEHVVLRMLKRIKIQARRAAKEPRKFVEWVESVREKNIDVWVKEWAPVIQSLLPLPDGVCERSTDAYFAQTCELMLTACECQPSELRQRVEECCATMDRELPGLMADEVLG